MTMRLFLAVALSAITVATSARTKGAESADVSPVKRVVAILTKMKEELVAETNNEEAMYDKMVCWCETNEKEKTQAIADAEAKDIELSTEIESRSAAFGQLSAEIAQLKKQIAEDQAALDEATAIREKAAEEFRTQELELVQAVTNLKNAIGVLKKHQGSLLQVDTPLASGMRVVLRDAAEKYELLQALAADRTHKNPASGLLQLHTQSKDGESSLDRVLLNALDVHGTEVPNNILPVDMAQRLLAQTAGGSSLLQSGEAQPVDAAYKSYNPQSGRIFGIMEQMLEEFESQLTTSQKEEAKAVEDYKALSTAKKEQIATGKEKLDEREESNAANQKALADAKEDLEMTRKQRSADVQFLRKLKITCQDLDKEFERRSATRAAELKAVAETIAILTEDDNREMLHKSVTLLQRSSANTMAATRNRIVETLLQAAKTSSPALATNDDLLAAWHSRHGAAQSPMVGAAGGPKAQLAALAMTAQLDSFTKLKEMMDTMVTELKKQQTEEVEFKEYCTKELNENEKATYDKDQHKKDLENKLEALETLMTKLQKEIDAAKKQIADTELEMKKASQNREGENKEFQSVVADQRATQEILKKALSRLEDFYKKGKGKEVISLKQDPTPPVQFNKYKENAGASPVMSLLDQIILDSVNLEKEATADEAQAQADYEKFTKNSNDMIKMLSDEIVAKTKAIADAKQDTTETEADHQNTVSELESLAAYESDLHGECDFTLKNFDIRQKARLQEIEAIQAAKGILSGAQGER